MAAKLGPKKILMTELFAPLPEGPFPVIYADPPWSYRGQVQHGGADKPFTSSAGTFYPVVDIDTLCDLPVERLRDPEGSVLFLWTTGPILEDAMRLMRDWGYKYKQIAFVWDKQMVNPGSYSMTQCEYVLVGTYKKIPKPRGARNIRQFFSERRTGHSRKPDGIARRIEEMFPTQRKLELFARSSRLGWETYGNEKTKFDIEGEMPCPK